MKMWLKISSENRTSGAWFFDLETAKRHARRWERLIPVEFPDWPNTADDADHSQDGDLCTRPGCGYPGPGIVAFEEERVRQMNKEGYDTARDNGHVNGELVKAGIAYAYFAFMRMHKVGFGEASDRALNEFPLGRESAACAIPCQWKPTEDIKRNLAKAGALLAAEYDRLCRAEQPSTPPIT